MRKYTEHTRIYNKEYRLKNKDKWKVYYKKHRLDRIARANNWRLKNPEHYLRIKRIYLLTPKGRLNSVKSSAKTRKIDYFLTDEIALKILSLPCYYCGNTLKIGIDRLDSNVGYIEQNCVPCCEMCNYMKRTYSKDKFINQCKIISKKHSQ